MEDLEKAKLIKEALKIVDELGKNTFEDNDELVDVQDNLQKLAKRAKVLKSNRHWKL
jgi:hypothetical protein